MTVREGGYKSQCKLSPERMSQCSRKQKQTFPMGNFFRCVSGGQSMCFNLKKRKRGFLNPFSPPLSPPSGSRAEQTRLKEKRGVVEGTEDEFPENVIDSRRWTKEKEGRKTTKAEGELEISLVPRRKKCRQEVPNFFSLFP